MNQDLTGMVDAVMDTVRASGLLTSLCTILVPPDVYNDAGGADPSAAYIPLAEHILIPCTAPPLQTGDTTAPSEVKALADIQAKSSLHVLLDNYYPAIKSNYRASIAPNDGFGNFLGDPVDYDIMNVESDSKQQMTRLAVQLVSI